MRFVKIEQRTYRDDTRGIDIGMAGIIMRLNMLDTYRLCDTGHLI